MKKLLSIACALLILFVICGCAVNNTDSTPETAPATTSITIDNSFVFVMDKAADNTTQQAVGCLQTTLDAKLKLDELDIVSTNPGENCIIVRIDSTMEEGAYSLRIQDSSVILTAQDPHVLLYAAKQFRQMLLDYGSATVTSQMCADLTAKTDISSLPFTFVTYNILFKDIEGGNTVSERQPRFKKVITEYQPDILGTQECSADWITYIDSAFKGTYVSSHTVSQQGNKGNPIYFRADRYELLDAGMIYLSPTPYVKSQFEGDSGPRACSWALAKDLLTGQTIFVADCHLDWNNDTQRALQLEVIFQEFETYMGTYPTLLCGDFNSNPEGPIYARTTEFLMDSRQGADTDLSTVDHTSHGFGEKLNFIDYIFHDDTFKPLTYQILSDRYNGYVSDHYGVLTDFQFSD